MKIDKIIMSTDDSHFKDFAPIVSIAWKKIFPEIETVLVYVTNFVSEKNKDIKYFLEIFDKLIVVESIEGIPSGNLAKIARRFACTLFNEDICMIEDIDTAPLNKKYLENIISKREKNTLGLVGKEVYEEIGIFGKCPASHSFAESYVWKRAINPNNLSFKEWTRQFIDIKKFDEKESINNIPSNFSDESLLRYILDQTQFADITSIIRGVNIYEDWIDRSWWNVDEEKLSKNGYISVNFMRPLDSRADVVVKHIQNMKF